MPTPHVLASVSSSTPATTLIKILMDTACTRSIAPEQALQWLSNVRRSSSLFTLGDNHTTLPAAHEGDVKIYTSNDNDDPTASATTVTFNCLKTGRMWLMSIADLTCKGHILLLRDNGPSYGIAPDRTVYHIHRDSDGSKSIDSHRGLWSVNLAFTKNGHASITSLPRDSIEAATILNTPVSGLLPTPDKIGRASCRERV